MEKRFFERIVLTKPSRADLRKDGFTLAEVLITLAIVGVVAAITMPALIANIQDRVRTARIQNIKQKFSKATDKMMSLSTLNGYASTMEFVNELQNHLKIAKICDNQHLNECWPTEEVILDSKGTTWAIKDTKTAKNLKMPENDSVDYDDTVGIITADGTPMILTYNKKCDIDANQTITWSNDQSSTTGCIGAVFDWNGSKMPNRLNTYENVGSGNFAAFGAAGDVILFNAGGLGRGCAFEINGSCFKAPTTISKAVSKAECEAMMSTHGIKSCGGVLYDSWAGAVATCGHVNKMASAADLAAIASDIYGTTIGAYDDKYDITINTVKAAQYGISPNGSYWTRHEIDDEFAYGRYFGSYEFKGGPGGSDLRDVIGFLVLCKE